LVLLAPGRGGAADAEVAGFAWADFKRDDRPIPRDTRPGRKVGELHYIYCAPEHQGRGGGAALYAAVEAAARIEGCTHLELVADSVDAEALLRFYRGCGLGYMFTRLRKELAAAPAGLAPLPIPFMPGGEPRPVAQEAAAAAGALDLDFGGSFCVLNSPTLGDASTIAIAIDAACALRRPGEAALQFWLTVPCIGENMCAPSNNNNNTSNSNNIQLYDT
jgi:GNAT superfamily N-acetyltransferase